ncbi:hypothetical protein BJ912DRAFT_930770 [Pholiota molesta]|nr:hypothetical protein BJ912DRAFT_930770 [Pholiota molesta]
METSGNWWKAVESSGETSGNWKVVATSGKWWKILEEVVESGGKWWKVVESSGRSSGKWWKNGKDEDRTLPQASKQKAASKSKAQAHFIEPDELEGPDMPYNAMEDGHHKKHLCTRAKPKISNPFSLYFQTYKHFPKLRKCRKQENYTKSTFSLPGNSHAL